MYKNSKKMLEIKLIEIMGIIYNLLIISSLQDLKSKMIFEF